MSEATTGSADHGHRWRRPLIILAILVALGTGWVAIAGSFLVHVRLVDDPDAIVSLSNGFQRERIEAAATAYRRHPGTPLVVFNDAETPVYNPVPDIVSYLTSRGVAYEDLRIVGTVASTEEEAKQTAALAARCRWDSILVVTDPYHTRRAGWIFRRAMPGVEVGLASTPTSVHPWTWWMHGEDRESVVLEWIKLAGASRLIVGALEPADPGAAC